MIEEKTDSAKVLEKAKKEQESTTKPTMHIRVYSPFKVYFDDEGDSISAVNATGPFDILPRHHNFMTLLAACEIVIRTFRGEEKIRISGGLMHVKADQVTVFLDI
jgi:F0F1-type ATP synthase epsilon subunit